MAATSLTALGLDLSLLEGKSIPRFSHGNLKTENLFEVFNFLDVEERAASKSKSKKKRRKTRGSRQKESSEPREEEGSYNALEPQFSLGDEKQKVQYLDKLTNIIAAKAKAEWENQIRSFELLQKENEKLQMAMKEKEKEFEKQKEKMDIKRAEISLI